MGGSVSPGGEKHWKLFKDLFSCIHWSLHKSIITFYSLFSFSLFLRIASIMFWQAVSFSLFSRSLLSYLILSSTKIFPHSLYLLIKSLAARWLPKIPRVVNLMLKSKVIISLAWVKEASASFAIISQIPIPPKRTYRALPPRKHSRMTFPVKLLESFLISSLIFVIEGWLSFCLFSSWSKISSQMLEILVELFLMNSKLKMLLRIFLLFFHSSSSLNTNPIPNLPKESMMNLDLW